MLVQVQVRTTTDSIVIVGNSYHMGSERTEMENEDQDLNVEDDIPDLV